jgi:negative regulator of flagellin synthesis FlgM
MYVHGTGYIHGPQPLGAPHRVGQAPAGAGPTTSSADRVEFSQQADLISRVSELPDIREGRVAELKRQIASGAYDTDQKLDIALDRMLEEIGAW